MVGGDWFLLILGEKHFIHADTEVILADGVSVSIINDIIRNFFVINVTPTAYCAVYK